MFFRSLTIICLLSGLALAVPNVEVTPPVISNGSTPVFFRYLNDSDTNVNVTFLKWFWGDGQSNVGPTPLTNIIHFYDNIGVYNVKLEISVDGLPFASNTFQVYVTNVTPGSQWFPVGNLPGFRNVMGAAWFVTPGGIKVLTGGAMDGASPNVASNIAGSSEGTVFQTIQDNIPIASRVQSAYGSELGKHWITGGLVVFSAGSNALTNDVWASTDGLNWSLTRANPNFPPRHYHALSAIGGKLILAGGKLSGGIVSNDVWQSVDGANWNLLNDNPAFSPRWGHSVTRFNGQLVLIGGQDVTGWTNSDIWVSKDGSNWSLATNMAAFGPRFQHSVTTWQNHLILSGGLSFPGPMRDIWVSRDGTNWGRITTNAPWSGRALHGFFAYNNRLIIAGGHSTNENISGNFANDLWVSPLIPNQPFTSMLGLAPSRWRLSGLPVQQTLSNIPGFFSNVMPPELWVWEPRMTNLNLGTKYVRPMNLPPGRGFWMLADVGLNLRGTSMPPQGPIYVGLVGGEWNLVANPFPVNIDRGALRTSPAYNVPPAHTGPLTSNQVDPGSVFIYSVAGTAQYVRVDDTQSIPVGAGFWIWAQTNCVLTMNPIASTNPAPPAYFGMASAPMAAGPQERALRLRLETGELADALTEVRTTDDGLAKVSPRPPVLAGMPRVTVMAGPTTAISRVTRVPFEVAGPSGVRNAKLSWELTGGGRLRYFLRDPATGVSTELKPGADPIEVALSVMGQARRYELVVAPDSQAAAVNAPLSLAGVVAYPSPVPRGQPVTFRYQLDRDASLTLEVRDSTGRLVHQDKRSEGSYSGAQLEWVWSGKALSGATPPAGLYNYAISAQSASGESARVVGKISLEAR